MWKRGKNERKRKRREEGRKRKRGKNEQKREGGKKDVKIRGKGSREVVRKCIKKKKERGRRTKKE